MPGAGGSPETARFAAPTNLPAIGDLYALLGWGCVERPIASVCRAPLNIAFPLALLAAFGVWVLLWRTRLGYDIRAFGHSEPAALYSGISATRIVMIAMTISGALCGMMAINSVMGEAERLVIDPVQGAGFVGIAVALMGRSHPAGVLLAALLFGMLYQGGGYVEFDIPAISRDMILVIQALVILFTGALDNMVRAPMERVFLSRRRQPEPVAPTNPIEAGGHPEKRVEP